MVVFFWLKGVGCAVCCTTEALTPLCQVSAETFAIAVQFNESNAMKSACHERNCCGQPVKNSFDAEPGSSNGEAVPLQITTNGELKICSLLASQTLAFTVSPKSTEARDFTPTPIDSLVESVSYTPDSRHSQPLEPRNRSGTYLQCCALLI